MAIVRTIISIPSQDSQYAIPGEYTAAQIQYMYAAQIPGIANMTSTVTESTGTGGEERTITFAVRAGNKG